MLTYNSIHSIQALALSNSYPIIKLHQFGTLLNSLRIMWFFLYGSLWIIRPDRPHKWWYVWYCLMMLDVSSYIQLRTWRRRKRGKLKRRPINAKHHSHSPGHRKWFHGLKIRRMQDASCDPTWPRVTPRDSCILLCCGCHFPTARVLQTAVCDGYPF